MIFRYTAVLSLAFPFIATAQTPCDSLVNAFFTPVVVQGTTYAFNNGSTSPDIQNTDVLWNFGDGATSTQSIPTHTFQSGEWEVCLTVTWQNCVSKYCDTLVVGTNNTCDSTFAATFLSTPVGNNTVLFNGATNLPALWHWWSFGDGAQGFSNPAQHTYPQAGQYLACYTAGYWNSITQDTCTTTYCQWVVANGSGTTCDSLQACIDTDLLGQQVMHFNNCTSAPGQGAQYQWTFGDGSGSTDISPTHTFPGPGTYTVCLIAYWQNCADSTCTTVQIGGGGPCEDLIAGWTSQTIGPLTVEFDATVVYGGLVPAYLEWNFGDGTYAYSASVTHTYPGADQFQVCLIVWGWDSLSLDTCMLTICSIVDLQAYSPCDSLNAGFTTTPNGLSAGFQSNVIDPQWSYLWDFGDGASGSGPIVQHTYPSDSTYQVCLLVWTWDPLTQDTCFVDHCEWLTVTNGGLPCDSLQACFVSSLFGQQVAFFNNCTSAPGQGAQYQWNFGDGTGSTDVSPVHTFPGPGTYNVCLIAYWQNCVDSTCTVVQISGGDPCDALTASWTHQGTGQLTVDFDATITYGSLLPAFLEWDFGDGTYAYSASTTHTFPGQDQFQVCLTVWAYDALSQDTCMLTVCGVIDLEMQSPCDSLNADFSAATNGLTASFQPAVFNPLWSYVWTFGDGTFGGGPSVQHTFTADSTYQVCLTVWTWDPLTQDTCFADHCELVTVSGGADCNDLQACFVPATIGQQVLYFNNCSAAPGPGIQYQWIFGDGSSSTDTAPIHTYPAPGIYTLCLIAYWQNCVDSLCSQVVVPGIGSPCDSLSADFDIQSNGTMVYLESSLVHPQWNYLWYFGDGTYDQGPNVTHTYPGGAVYNACLVVWAWDPLLQDTCFAEHCEEIDLLTTAIAPPFQNDDLVAWPVPFSTELHLRGSTLLGAREIRLTDPTGHLVWRELVGGRMEIDLSLPAFASGVYFLEVQGDKRTHIQRLMRMP